MATRTTGSRSDVTPNGGIGTLTPPAPTPPGDGGAGALRRVAVAGNPNCGKSTLFNALTGLRQKVGNYPGVTVEKKVGRCRGLHGEPLELLDLPGAYSLQARSPDETITRDVLLGRVADTPRPDVVVCVVDASNLERNLYFVSQILETGLPAVLVLNMVDLAEARGWVIDGPALAARLGLPVVATVAHRGVGMVELKAVLSRPHLARPREVAPLPAALAREVGALARRLDAVAAPAGSDSRGRGGGERLLSVDAALAAGPGAAAEEPSAATAGSAGYAQALFLLSLPETGQLAPLVPDPAVAAEVTAAAVRLRAEGVDPATAPVEARYRWVQEICRTTRRGGEAEGAGEDGEHGAAALTVSDRLDRVLTHRLWGWLAFLGVMGLMFLGIFSLATVPMDWIRGGFDALGDAVKQTLPPGDFRSLLADGVIAGVGGVVVFLPQILILFLFIGLLEDTGYMARAAFIIDRVMTRVGLHGKSFIPLLSSFACAIPGIMSARTIESPKDRLTTILVAPLMSCSARLPVYSLLIAAMLPTEVVPVWQKAGLMLAMYLLGMAAAFGAAWLFKRTLFRGEPPLLILELPPYRWPSPRTVGLQMLQRAGLFLRRAGTVILAIAVVLWALSTYPKHPDPAASPSEALAYSCAGRIGHAVEPAIRPLGYDWHVGIGLVSSFAAREVFVGTMAIIYNLEDSRDHSNLGALRGALRAARWPDGRPVFTPLVCLGLMVFYVLAMQCMSTLAVVRRETNSWRWPLFQLAYMTVLAYVGALVIYQGGRLLGWG